jgi:hypothetical protein
MAHHIRFPAGTTSDWQSPDQVDISWPANNELRPVGVGHRHLVPTALGSASRCPRRGSPHGLSTGAPSTNEQLWVKFCWGDEGRLLVFFSFLASMFLSLHDYKKGPIFLETNISSFSSSPRAFSLNQLFLCEYQGHSLIFKALVA